MAVIGVIGGLLGALFNQLTLYMTSWRRNSLHKKGNRVKVIFDGRLQEILHLYYVYLLEELLSRWWS
jgi:chloride channel 7